MRHWVQRQMHMLDKETVTHDHLVVWVEIGMHNCLRNNYCGLRICATMFVSVHEANASELNIPELYPVTFGEWGVSGETTQLLVFRPTRYS